ncbi:aminotransferase class III-fold pyridoxal phosphate-dependent enzyme [Cyanobium sp. FGCU-52]|nr:aminotransferase class III-fold pyridoxal phosphate-dependent enzyme [Cyanobium sp. FGCU52]
MSAGHPTFPCSEALLEQALAVIPLGSQTFSKSLTQLPRGVSPFFVDRAEGPWFWDVDGHRFLDLTNGLACITLGHRNPLVDQAVRTQLERGVTFSLPHPLERQVAELIIAMVPCAEMVRFGKNGTDATSGAIRLARHCTGRDRVAICGYHGWQDWSIGTTSRHGGIPLSVRELSHTFPYNDLSALAELLAAHPGEFAAVILEPMNIAWPQPGYLEGVQALAHQHGALLVFDETITGFRFSNGGAQALFGVTPDLACFGKGLANGYPLSALTGRRELMERISEIFFSGTFGGETLSLAAAKAVLELLSSQPITEQLAAAGQQLAERVSKISADLGLAEVFGLSGHPSWMIWSIRDHANAGNSEIRTLLLQELYSRGIFTIGSHNISAAHDQPCLDLVVQAYSEVLPLLSEALMTAGGVGERLRCDPLVPLFRVR